MIQTHKFLQCPINTYQSLLSVVAVVAEGWTADPQTRMFVPKKADPPPQSSVPSEQQLSRLTDFVAFLENWSSWIVYYSDFGFGVLLKIK